MEEIKSKYYREMKKFIGIPNIFKGVSGDGATDLIFPAIIDRNASGFLTCYQKAYELFKRLDSVQSIFKVGKLTDN
jgi:dynein heavy chain 2